MASSAGATLREIATAAGVAERAVFGVWDAYGAVGLPFVQVSAPDVRGLTLRLTSEDERVFYIEVCTPRGRFWSGDLTAGPHLAAWLRTFSAGSFSIDSRPFRSWRFEPADDAPSLRLHRLPA
ncbi:hypothetical protein [Cellulomonas sp. 73-145]|uniref:hypothetical protein n=1 Tax=Cellulomonas sp. 73-145 TaxID=1895739 RepID=UPI001AD07C53|nr:hypothetical protein [Cellulomonas sp. 73-145]MBN9326594.1 hypothetical protein [Cellulomonas sp.]